ncbi:MAG: SDR family oxidoreductase [Chloroflexi bacterium]|nr:SDR family oxidoreductase [Chloroflexota bacterium]
MDLQLTGKRALVAGASAGLGYAAARLLAEEGCTVAVNSRDAGRIGEAAQRIAQETEATAHALPADLTQPDAAAAVVAQAVDMMGGLDLLLTNTAGPPSGPFETFDDAAWQKAIDMCLMAHVRLIRAALPHLRQSDCPSILTVTSFTVRQPLDHLVLSNSVRLATIGLTKTLSQELGPKGIRVNSILPGWTETERVTDLLEQRSARAGDTPEDEAKRIAAGIPLGRMAAPEEFARAAVFLLSPAASYITGVMLPVDGGIIKGV